MKSCFLTIIVAGFLDCVFSIAYDCGDLLPGMQIKFRCRDQGNSCLTKTKYICDYYLDADCPNDADMWTGLCDSLCPAVTRDGVKVNSFICDDECEEDFLLWCDGKVDCPRSGIDEAHCNCTANPSDCSLEWKDRWKTGDYLKIILPIVVVVLLLLAGIAYGLLCKREE